MALPDDFLKFEIEQILCLQEKLKGIEPLLEIVSYNLSPTNAQYIIGPLITALTGESITECVLTTTIADFCSLMLKWSLHEDRPYWYIHEPGLYLENQTPKLRQHSLTCETTAGGPSGHSVMLTVIAYLQGRWLVNYMEEKFEINRYLMSAVVATGVGSLVALCWASRMYFAAHFLHQCIAGSTLALSIVSCLEVEGIRKRVLRANRRKTVGFALGMMLTSGLVYGGLVLAGIDPMMSVRKAIKCCESPKNIRVESTPIYNIVRNLGCAFGLAACAPLSKKQEKSKDLWRSVPVTAGFLIINSVILAKAPKDCGSCMYLGYVFCASLFHSYAMIELVPKVTNMEPDESEESKEEKPKAEGEAEKKPGGEAEPEAAEELAEEPAEEAAEEAAEEEE